MAHVITFTNHAPIKIADSDLIRNIWSDRRDWGHHELRCYTTKRGKCLYWASENSGIFHGSRDPETYRTYLPSAAAIREYFADMDRMAVYHAEVEVEVDPAAIIDVDAL